MAEETEKMTLLQKLEKIRKGAEVIQKNKAGYGYKYTSIDVILACVTANMDKYHVSLIPTMGEHPTVEPFQYTKIKYDKNQNRLEENVIEYIFRSEMVYIWINNDHPEDRIEVPWFVVGSQSDPSQASGAAMTYGLRYFLTQYFQIATPEDDPDEFRSRQREVAESESATVAHKIIAELDSAVKLYLSDHEDQREAVMSVVKKYVKNGNYNLIKNPELASKLFREFKSKFMPETIEVSA